MNDGAIQPVHASPGGGRRQGKGEEERLPLIRSLGSRMKNCVSYSHGTLRAQLHPTIRECMSMASSLVGCVPRRHRADGNLASGGSSEILMSLSRPISNEATP